MQRTCSYTCGEDSITFHFSFYPWFFCNLVEDFVNISDRIVINTQDPQIIDSGKSIK